MGSKLLKSLRVICLLALCQLALVRTLLATGAVVTHRANLRSDPSATHKPVRTLDPDEELDLIDPSLTDGGYYHVRTEDGTEGYVYGRSIKIVEETPNAPTPAPATPPPPDPSVPVVDGAPATSIPTNWNKPTPQTQSSQEVDGVCPPGGDGGDQETNVRKNRTDVADNYHDVAWSAIANLEYPVAGKTLDSWTDEQKKQIEPYEGVALRTVGYLVAIKPQTGSGGESTNCHFHLASEVDWHIALVSRPGDGEKTSVVVETTPRVRQSHPKWTATALKPWLNTDSPVRISGWLLLDPEHRNHLGKYRSTLWEIHPITKIEVMKDGAWVDLDEIE